MQFNLQDRLTALTSEWPLVPGWNDECTTPGTAETLECPSIPCRSVQLPFPESATLPTCSCSPEPAGHIVVRALPS